VGFADFATSITLLIIGFSFYRQPRAKFFKSFPLRPITLLAPKESSSPNLSYFYRPHKSTTHRPIVLIHGFGIGLAPYIPLIVKLPKDVGILAIELLPVSCRITTALPLAIDLARECADIISQQDLKDFVFVGNSYGSFFTKLFLDSTYLSNRMHSVIILDPVAVLVHFPDLAYNVTTRTPMESNEWQLWRAAQTDPDIAFTLGRRFCWHDHVVWREDLLSRPTTLIMGSCDSFVNPAAIATYITEGIPEASPNSAGIKPGLQWTWQDLEKWKTENGFDQWRGEGLELIWLEGYDHGSGLMSPKMLPRLVECIMGYCEKVKKQKTQKEEMVTKGSVNDFEPASKPELGTAEVIDRRVTMA
jgi:pimeloyl-ACP methyl ester carboxylesterase